MLTLLLAACASGPKGPDSRLPREWPLAELNLPRNAEVFEGRVKQDRELEDGRVVDQYAAFFVSSDQWDEVQRHVEACLRPLDYRVVELPAEATPIGGGELRLRAVYASADGLYLVTLLFEMTPQSARQSGLPQSYYTLMLERRQVALPPSEEWPVLELH